MKIRIRPSSGEQRFVYIDVVRTEKVEVARQKIAQALEQETDKLYPVEQLSLIYSGKQLADGMTLFDYGVSHGDTFLTHLKAKPMVDDADDATVVDCGSSSSPTSISASIPAQNSPTPISTPLPTGAANETSMTKVDAALNSTKPVDESGEPAPEVTCDFCDNTLNSKCNHCGCHYCGLKDDEHHTLACDECGLFFHMRCLPEPLTTIPEGDWYCDLCKNDPNLVVSGEKKLDMKGTRRSKMPSAKQTKQWGGGMACAGTTKTCTIVSKDHIGSIPGVHVGQSWRFRIHVSESGIHRPPVGGISGGATKPAMSIVLAGGYPEDIDRGEEFVYTGSGGYDLSGNKRQAKVQSFDQELTRQNRGLALACAAPLDDKVGGTAKNWKQSSAIRVCRSYKVAKLHPEYAPAEGVRYDGLYRIVKYWKEKGVSGFYVWRYLFRRDDPEPAPWTDEGKAFIEKMGFTMYDPDGDADGRTGKTKAGSAVAGTKRKNEGESSVQSPVAVKRKFQPTAALRELVRLDTDNTRMWANIHEKEYATESAYLEELTEGHLSCPICQELVQQPVTLPCGHNICCPCLCRSMDNYGIICPMCRHDISSMGSKSDVKGKVNQNLVTIIRALIPSYGSEWITEPKVTSTQFARREGQPAD
ncbi:hypothetical protein IW142_004479 [Coemansia sp. RSA 564]|nr:hypothetical protein IW142_004479 [Coemansia sp. RSA 564]